MNRQVLYPVRTKFSNGVSICTIAYQKHEMENLKYENIP
jgi:hypothetical protein